MHEEIKRLQVLGLLGIASVGTLQAQVGFRDPVPQEFGVRMEQEVSDSIVTEYNFVDRDGDGDVDVFYPIRFYDSSTGYFGYTCRYQENVLPGTFHSSTPVNTTTLCVYYDDVVYADIDQDGDLDTYRTVSVPYGYSSGRTYIEIRENDNGQYLDLNDFDDEPDAEFDIRGYYWYESVRSRSVAFADMDGDGLSDLVVNAEVILDYGFDRRIDTYVYLNNGDGSAMPYDESLNLNPYGLDEVFDLFLESGEYIYKTFWEDLDVDGDPDLALVTSEWSGRNDTLDRIFNVYFALNDGADEAAFFPGIHHAFRVLLQNSVPWYLGVADQIDLCDIDADGDPDFLFNEKLQVPYDYYSGSNILYFYENDAVQATGLHTPRRLPLNIYPNPAASVATVQLSGTDHPGPYQIEIMDASGKTIHEFSTEVPTIYLKQSDVGPGLFMVRLNTPDGEAVGSGKLIFVE